MSCSIPGASPLLLHFSPTTIVLESSLSYIYVASTSCKYVQLAASAASLPSEHSSIEEPQPLCLVAVATSMPVVTWVRTQELHLFCVIVIMLCPYLLVLGSVEITSRPIHVAGLVKSGSDGHSTRNSNWGEIVRAFDPAAEGLEAVFCALS